MQAYQGMSPTRRGSRNCKHTSRLLRCAPCCPAVLTWHSSFIGGLILTPAWKGAAFSTARPFQQQLARKGRPAHIHGGEGKYMGSAVACDGDTKG